MIGRFGRTHLCKNDIHVAKSSDGKKHILDVHLHVCRTNVFEIVGDCHKSKNISYTSTLENDSNNDDTGWFGHEHCVNKFHTCDDFVLHVFESLKLSIKNSNKFCS